MHQFKFLVLALAVLFVAFGLRAPTASAAPITWSLDGVSTLSSPAAGTISGTFVFDAVGDVYSSISIVRDPGGFSYEDFLPAPAPTATDVTFIPSIGTPFDFTFIPQLILTFFDGLDTEAAQGFTATEILCLNASCSSAFVTREFSGLVSAVPIPPALALFLSGLAAFGFVARRKRPQIPPVAA